MIKEKFDIVPVFENVKEDLGLFNIDKIYEKDIDISQTEYVKHSIRSGIRKEFSQSVVLLGDLNPGAEIMAGGNIIIIGKLRGLAHAGAGGNKSAIIAASETEKTQIRIADEVQEIEPYDRNPIFYIEDGTITVKHRPKKEYKYKK